MVFAAINLVFVSHPARAGQGSTPVILDTDIGGDIDDTWALGFLLKSPELDLKLALSDDGMPEYRARLLARFLTDAGRPDVPVGLGVGAREDKTSASERESSLTKDYDLKQYAGPVKTDGVQALIDIVMSSPVPVTIICIGPPRNIAEALKRQPEIARKARFVGMFGSVRVGYNGSKTPSAEWNVRASVPSAQATLSAPWSMITITPLDTCGIVQLTGQEYQEVLNSHDPAARAVIEGYRSWSSGDQKQAETASTTLFDTVAVYLAFSQAGLKMEQLPIVVTDQGMTVIKPGGTTMSVATEWKDLEGFKRLLVQRLSGTR